MRPIDADGLKKSIEEDEELKNNSLAYLLMNLMTCYIDDAPTIDTEPVRHGHWVRIKYAVGDWMRCSACEENIWTAGEFAGLGYLERFCPNCGAKMDNGG